MASINFKLSLPTIPASSSLFLTGMELTARIRERLQTEAGTLVLDAIRNHLGQDSLYRLEPGYAARKPNLKQFRRYGGKSADQPLILSGELYQSLTVVPTNTGFLVEMQDGQAVSEDGFDYGEFFEDVTLFLEKGLADVEDRLAEILANIIVDEMML